MGAISWKFISIVLGWTFMLHGISYSEKAPNYSFVKEATSAPRHLHYDYIIIGGGTAGCPLAATLSSNATVLVLERGGSPYGNPNVEEEANFPVNFANMSPDSPSEHFISEDGVYNTRARVLGGGSAINAGFYTHASNDYVKEIGWRPEMVNESYAWVEKKIVFEPPMLQWQSAVRDGLIEAGVRPYNGFSYDHINGTKVGGSIFDKDGHRHTAADLLDYADPTNIAVYLHATVIKILFRQRGRSWSRPRAYGVIFEDASGMRRTALLSRNRNLKNEIILSAGALGSPQLLMLSGIGPRVHLQSHGIQLVLDQPMVGEGMGDNPMNVLVVPSGLPVEVSLVQVVGITQFGSFIETISGLTYAWAQRFVDNYEQHFNHQTQTDKPNVNLVTLKAMSTAIETLKTLMNSTLRGGVILEKIMGPLSRGDLKLRTANPKDTPSVKFNYFKEPEDLKMCVDGMKTIIDVVNSKAFSKFRRTHLSANALITLMAYLPVNLRPRHVTTAISLEQFCIDTVMSIWHYHGGCQVGKVVDHDYRVVGVDGLRVIDGSTFLTSPGTNPQATLMMLGRYMGRRIQEQRLS